MALVNNLMTCKDLKDQFIERLSNESSGFSEVRIVFDRYIDGSLKEQIREKRTSGKSGCYIVKDSTTLAGLTMKQFLSHIQTKSDLTAYLSEYAIHELANMGRRFVVMFETKSISNIPDYPVELQEHNQEEANTLMLLQASNVCEIDPFTDLYVVSPDTDVFLLLIYFYPQLCANTIFRAGTATNFCDIEIHKVYESI